MQSVEFYFPLKSKTYKRFWHFLPHFHTYFLFLFFLKRKKKKRSSVVTWKKVRKVWNFSKNGCKLLILNRNFFHTLIFKVWNIFGFLGKVWNSKIFFLQKSNSLRISRSMNKYVYQIQGALEHPQSGKLSGLRILVCDLYNFDSVDAPISVLDKETAKYLEFRIKVTENPVNIQRLPYAIQNKIRVSLGKWLDQWVLENFYGNTGNRKGVNP